MHEQEITLDQAYLSYFRVICLYIMSKLQCDRYTAEDIAAETFLTLQLKWDTISPRNSGVIAVWLYRTADNKIRDHKKSLARTPMMIDMDSPAAQELRDETDERAMIDQAIDYQRLLDRIRRALSKKDWALSHAIYVEELSSKDLMQQFRINADTLYLRRSRLKHRLQKIVSKNPREM